MVKDEILSALKNALERKESLEDAKTSLMTAGYPISDVEDAAREITMPSSLIERAPSVQSAENTSGKIMEKIPSPPAQFQSSGMTASTSAAITAAQSAPKPEPSSTKKLLKWGLIGLGIVLLILGIFLLLKSQLSSLLNFGAQSPFG